MGRLPIEAATSTTVHMDGREILAFGGCNYLGLAHHPRVMDAVRAGWERFGLTTTASRETTGNTLLHEALETELASFAGHEHAILSAEGYTANFMCCQALAGLSGTGLSAMGTSTNGAVTGIGVAIIDAQCHRSIRNAASASGMQVVDFEHLNADSAAWLASRYADQGVCIMTDSVFAADGAVAPLRALLDALPRHLPTHRGMLLVDDCHGFCVLGRDGRGATDHHGLVEITAQGARTHDPRIVVTTTLAKGLGCYGGVVMGKAGFVRQVREKAWVYRSSTPVPPPIAEGARAAVGLLRNDATLVRNLRRNCTLVREGLSRMGLPVPEAGVPIFTFALPTVERMRMVYDRMLAAGVLTPLIDYPGGPTPLYFRIVVNACHSVEQIERLLSTLREAMGLGDGRLTEAKVGERALA
jgi:8-amino-7-oxononanoate synthase